MLTYRFILALVAALGLQAAALFAPDPSALDQASAPAAARHATVIVDGVERGTTPGTIRVFRSLGDSEIALKVGDREVRRFVLEKTYSSNASNVVFNLPRRTSGTDLELLVNDLATRDDSLYYIPQLGRSLVIEDLDYGLTLEVRD